MNILITGGAGFIGSAVVRRVLADAAPQRVVVLDSLTYAGHLGNLTGPDGDPRYRFEHIDLCDREGVSRVFRDHRITHVLHLAAESHVDRSIHGPGAFIQTNIVGTFHLLEACRESGFTGGPDRRVVHVSTDEVYGSLGPEGAFSEATPYAPNSPYSASKASSDFLVRAYHHTYGLPAVITNCSNNFGPRQFPEKLIPVVIQSALAGQPIPVYGDGLQVRDWLYVEDHAQALWLALTQGIPGRTYNIGGGNECTNLRLVEHLCDLVDAQSSRPPGTARGGIRFVTDRPGHDRRYAIDSARIRSELGWKPARRFENDLESTVKWYLDNQAWVRQVKQPKST